MGPSVSARPPAILVADDQPDVVEALRLLLRREGFDVATASSPAGVLAAVEARDVDAALVDMNYARDTTSGREGLDLVAELRARDPTLPVVVMTAWGSVEGAVEAMRRGARDYVQKPWDNVRLVATLRTQVELRQALRRGRLLSAEARRGRERDAPEVVAVSRAMQEVLRVVERVAPSDAHVLVTGEHGAGKEVVARRLHALSARADRPLVTVNAGALAEGVLESELFGHVKGAFTDARQDRIGCFELADGGTLFLDEIATMPVAQQAKLLRALQTGELAPVGSSRVRKVDVRVVSATNADLADLAARGAFREDLLYRLNTVEIRVPPLRERREDVPRLAELFLARHAARYRKPLAGFEPDALDALVAHAWPGNVRELEHAVERAALMAEGEGVRAEDLALRARGAAPSVEDMTLDEAERWLVERALDRTGGNVVEAARRLGLSRSALYRRLQQHGIRVPER
jgi:DNA-binding NtrC family response regulator